MDLFKLIQYIYFLGVGLLVSGVYLIVLYIILGETERAMKEASLTAIQLVATIFLRDRFNLKP
ncbi:hypothetical protein [Paenibacillus sp. 1P03SA]|uniref:hypothetical protein n=1 Tax=Paenibacillus sp. 1P03SA TaxID=3132294 RepID=UPI0039A3672B